MSELLSLASRKRIFEHVEANGGCHLREIGRKCDVPLGTALYHLDRLEAEGLLTVRRDGRYKRYFTANGLGRREKDLLAAFRHAVPRRIAATLLEHPGLTQRELCAHIGVSRSTLSFHVNGLIAKEIVRREPARPENKYVLTDVAITQEILTKYRESLGDFSPMRRITPEEGPARTADANAPRPTAVLLEA